MADDGKAKAKVPTRADDKEQSERFIDSAREHEVDESEGALERAFRKIRKAKRDNQKTP